MRELTIVFPHFCNLGMLAEQQRVWAGYPDDLKSHLHIIVADDCSPDGLKPTADSIVPTGVASVRLFRSLPPKKRWNWLASRNKGANEAATEWMLLTDIDHVVPAETLRRIMDGDLDPLSAYRFKRVTVPHPWPYQLSDCLSVRPDGTKEKTHNDSWLLTKSLFNYDDGETFVCGYDERLSGCYGTSGEFKDRVLSVARTHVVLNEALVRYPRDIIADASTSPDVYTRKNDPLNDDELRRRKEDRGRGFRWRPMHGLVQWEEVPLC